MLTRLFSLVGLSWGGGSVGYFNAEGGTTPPSYPAYGTILNTMYNVEYPIANGGDSVLYNSVYYASETCDVNLLADGYGGAFWSYSTATNIQFKSYGTIFTTNAGTNYITISGNTWPNGSFYEELAHDGSGGYVAINASTNFASYGYTLGTYYDPHNGGSLEVWTGSGNFYPNTYYNDYICYSDGVGGYYQQDYNTYGATTFGYFYRSEPITIEVPYGSSNYHTNGLQTEWIADGNYGYTTQTGGTPDSYGTVYVSNPVEIAVPYYSSNYYANGLTNDYIADGMGGYGASSGGTPYTIGTLIYDNITSTGYGNYVEIPSGSASYYYDQWYGERYVWDGSGGYYLYFGQFYYANGTYIYNDGTWSYYWDGAGGFYAV